MSVGAVLFAAGLAAAIAIGFLAPFTRDYTPLHIQLAFTAFIGVCSGTLICLIIAALSAVKAGRFSGAALAGTVVVQGGRSFILFYLYFTPHFFTYHSLPTSLALWEWLLCVDCGASLWILTAALDAVSTR